MKKYLLFFILIYFVLLFLPLAVSAIEYPFGTLGANPTPCEYMKTVFVWGLGIVGALAVVAIAYGGFRYMVGNVQPGKEIIYSALLGLLLLMASWLILYTINPDLATMKCELPSTGTTTTGTPSTGTPTTGTPSGTLTEQAARDRLASDGIGVKADCPVGQSTNCVDLEDIKSSTLTEVESLASQAGKDNVYVTAGTEGCGTIHATGLRSHCTGDKVDIRPNATLDNYIQTNYTYVGTRSDGAKQYKAPDGAIYAKESDHWDVLSA